MLYTRVSAFMHSLLTPKVWFFTLTEWNSDLPALGLKTNQKKKTTNSNKGQSRVPSHIIADQRRLKTDQAWINFWLLEEPSQHFYDALSSLLPIKPLKKTTQKNTKKQRLVGCFFGGRGTFWEEKYKVHKCGHWEKGRKKEIRVLRQLTSATWRMNGDRCKNKK